MKSVILFRKVLKAKFCISGIKLLGFINWIITRELLG